MSKLLSYIWPQSTIVDTDFSGKIELRETFGKKVLLSRNAVYSYGQLQKVLEHGISKVDLNPVKSILLLGLGGGSVVNSLRNKFEYKHHITAVEIDSKLIELSQNVFGLKEDKQLELAHADAMEYTKHCNRHFDLIIIDIFIDDKVPQKFYTKKFTEKLISLLNEDGAILFNIGIDMSNRSILRRVTNFFNENPEFQCKVVEGVRQSSTLLLIERKNQAVLTEIS